MVDEVADLLLEVSDWDQGICPGAEKMAFRGRPKATWLLQELTHSAKKKAHGHWTPIGGCMSMPLPRRTK